MTRVVSLLLAVVMVLSMAVLPASAAGFRDVQNDAWYAEAVDYVTARGYMAGTGEDSFAPNAAVTRAMFVTVLAKMAGAETDNNVHPFEDVPAGTWYSGAVAWAAEQGIVCGTGAGKFSPEKNITRQDMSLILANFVMAIGYKLPQEEQKTFADADKISAYAREAVAFGTGAGLMSGYSDGTFRPTATATRAQLAVIVMALDKKIQGLDAEPVPMPAQSFEKTASGISVGVKAPVGAVPAGTELELSRVTDEAYLNDIGARTGTGVIGAVDISFLKDGAELEPERAVEVEISMPGLEAVQNPALLHVRDDGSLELVSGVEKVNGTKGGTSLKFTAKDFSVYVFVAGGSEEMLTVNFYQGSTRINSQIIRLSQYDKYVDPEHPIDFVYDPGVPEITATQSFEGWKTEDFDAGVNDTNLNVADINAYIKAHFNKNSLSTDLNFYAMVYNVHYLIYHDQAGAVVKTQSYHVETEGQPAPAKIEMNYVGFKGGQNFAGWIEEKYISGKGDYPLYTDDVNSATVYKYEETYSFTGDMQLYPYLTTGAWLVFDTYKDQDDDPTSTTFIPPAFYAEGEVTAAPTKPVRVGYTFDGWYKDKNFTERFVFGSTLAERTTVYAKWTPKETTYTVVFWQQKNTDTPTTANADKDYDYYASVERTATTGQTVKIETDTTGETADNRLAYNSDSSIGEMGYYFVYNETNSAPAVTGAVVKGDGTTVLNVYYDRKVITFKYYESNKTTLWTPTGSGYVEAENGEYYYYTAQESGYYLIGHGPNASYKPTGSDTIYYFYSPNASTYTTPDAADAYLEQQGYTFFASDSSNAKTETYSNLSNNYWSTAGTLYEKYRFSNNSYDSWIPYYYRFTENYTTGYYRVGTGPNPEAAGTHNLQGAVGQNTISGLYGAQLASTDWPNPGSGYVWANDDGNSSYNYPLALTEFVPVSENGPMTEVKFYLTTDSGTKIPIHYVGENLDGSGYNVLLTEGYTTLSTSSTTRSWYPNETIQGFTITGYRFGTSGSWTNATTTTEIALPTSASGGDLYVAFKRNTHSLSFVSNNATITPEGLPTGIDLTKVPFGTDFASFRDCKPATEPEGYFFDGWYADPSCDTEFDFDAAMPDNNVRIYAKWTKIRFRVVVEPRGGDTNINPADITIPNGQATAFRIDYGEAVEGANFNDATRTGYTLLGWYLDTDKTNNTVYDTLFDFGRAMTDQGNMADMTYGVQGQDETDEAYAARRSGVDPWNNNKAYNDEDGEHDDVVGKIVIYGRWREDPDGVIGVNVRYLATDAEGNTGKMAGDATEWNDPDIYADGAEAYCQPAAKPDSTALSFLYWEILGRDGKPTGRKAYPGQTWDVLYSDAVEEAINSGSSSNPEYLTYPNTPAMASEQASTKGPTRAATPTYQRVSTPTPGKFYLIAYVNGSTAYLMGTDYYNDASPKAVSATVSNNTITGHYEDYQFGVEQNSGYYRFGSLYYMTYLSINYVDDWFSYTGYLRYGNDSYNNNPSTYWSYTNGNLVNYNSSISSSYRYVRFNGNNDNNRRFELSGSGNASQIVFFELQEPEITGNEYTIATELKVGQKYVIAVDDRALGKDHIAESGNVPYFVESVRVKHNTTGTESVIVDETEESEVLWEVVSGNASEGYVLKNVTSGKYLGLNSANYLAPLDSTTTKWLYDGTDLDSQFTGDGSGSYRYLAYSSMFNDFTLSSATGNNVKIYAATTTYTVTFKDGRTNEVIKTEEVEEGGSATAPEAPDHTDTGWIFSGWDTPYDNVTSDLIVTAQYTNVTELKYTVTFRYMTSAGVWETVSVTDVQHGSTVAFPVDADHPDPTLEANWPTGYEFNSWDKKLTNITSNLTINAVYKQTATTKYVVTLRAVYGRSSTDAKTHIYWYANNGTEYHNKGGERDEQVNLTINHPYDIPTPATWEGDQGGSLINRGRKFLGWARVENTGSGEEGSDQSALNSVDDCWLIWHEDSSYEGGGYYTVNETGVDSTAKITEVAADEMKPYHDLYAVWGPCTLFYVFHSATGKLEAIDVNAVKGTAGTGTYDLTSVVTPGYLYGGYYKQYGYITATQMQTVVDKFENGGALDDTGWDEPSTVVNNVLAVYTPKDADGFTKYTGAAYTNGTDKPYKLNADGTIETGSDGKPVLYAPVWVNAQAYKKADGADEGNKLSPVAGEVYYLKEVPESYLTSRIAWTYDTVQRGKVIDVFLLSVVDDNNYSSVAFRTVNGVAGEGAGLGSGTLTTDNHLAKTFSLVTKPADGGEQLDPVVIDPSTFGVTYGNIAVSRQTAFAEADAFSMLPTWTTLDGVVVTNDPVAFTRKDDFGGEGENTYGGFGWQRVFDGKETIYVNVTLDWWENAGAATVYYFFDETDQIGTDEWGNPKYRNKAVLATETAVDNLYVAAVPEGKWTHMIIVRCNSATLNADLSNMWDYYGPDDSRNVKWNQTGNNAIPKSSDSGTAANISFNYVPGFYEGDTNINWGIYPTN